MLIIKLKQIILPSLFFIFLMIAFHVSQSNMKVVEAESNPKPVYLFSIPENSLDGGISDATTNGNYIYFTMFNYSRIDMYTFSGEYVKSWGSIGVNPGQFDTRPTDIDIDSQGYLYVSTYAYVHKFTQEGDFVEKWVASTVENDLGAIFQLTIDNADNVLVSGTNYKVFKYTSEGSFINGFGQFGNGNGQFGNKQGLAVDSENNIYVLDGQWDMTYRVQKFTTDGTFVSKIITQGSMDGYITFPRSLEISNNDILYVGGDAYKDLQLFNVNGGYIRKYPNSRYSEILCFDSNDVAYVLRGPSPSRKIDVNDSNDVFIRTIVSPIIRPTEIIIDNSYNFYALEKDFVSSFNIDFNTNFDFLLKFKDDVSDYHSLTIGYSGNIYFAFWNYLENKVYKYSPLDKSVNEVILVPGEEPPFYSIRSVFEDSNESLYIMDYLTSSTTRIQIFSKTGSFERSIYFNTGSIEGAVHQPLKFVLDDFGNIYILSYNYWPSSGAFLQKFDNEGNFIKCLAVPGTDIDQLTWAETFTIHQDKVYVADTYKNRILLLDLDGNFLDSYENIIQPSAIDLDQKGNIYIFNEKDYTIDIYGFPDAEIVPVETAKFNYNVIEGDTIQYDIYLTSPITENITVDIYEQITETNKSIFPEVYASSERVVINPDPLVFTPDNWMMPQTITLEIIDNDIIDGNTTISLEHTLSGEVSYYTGLNVGTITLNISDNDVLAGSGSNLNLIIVITCCSFIEFYKVIYRNYKKIKKF